MSPSIEKILNDAAALRASGKNQEALALLNGARQKEGAPALFLAMADIFSALGIAAGVEQVLQEGARLYPEEIALTVALANHYYREDRSAEGLRLIKPLAEKAGAGVDILLSYAALSRAAGESDAARAALEKILARDPKNIAAISNLAGIYLDARDHEKAARLFEEAQALDKSNAHILSQLSLVYFRQGKLEEAWKAYEARFGFTATARGFSQPLWQGQNLGDHESLLLYGEQGAGEEIMHASMLADALALSKNIAVECDARLAPLFARSFPEIRFVAKGEALGDFNYQAPMGHLGFLFRKNFAAFPKRASYLKADAQKTAMLREKYKALAQGKKIIGISWKSKKLRQGDPKSTALADWRPVFAQPAFFVSLQYEDDENSPAWRDETMNQKTSLDDFAAQVAAMDAVITVSNTTAHMAGALGIKTALLLPASGGLMGHWFDNREDSPWYPSATLLRQSHDGVWDDVMQRAAEFLREA